MFLRKLFIAICLLTSSISPNNIFAQENISQNSQSFTLKGQLTDSEKKLPIINAILKVTTTNGSSQTTTDNQGKYSLNLKDSSGTITISGKNLVEKEIAFSNIKENLDLEATYVVPIVYEGIVIKAESLEPQINRQDETLYKEGFPARDDQVLFQFGSGINAGQHEGGGKSLEIRRFGFNLDHGGVGPGLLIRVDNFDQNQATQGHGQGYLGQLKSLSTELIDEVQILNGPFTAQYGNFSGLGVVQVSLKESLAQTALIRLQGGSFNTKRGFFAISPQNGFIAYELARTDTPFDKPYDRDNVTGSYKFNVNQNSHLLFKLNFGRNDFFSSGQIPVDLIQSREIARFGAIDGTEGGKVRTFNGSVLFKKDYSNGSILKLDGLIARSLFDLYNNFTFFLDRQDIGDQFNQHDSRLQQGVNFQYIKPYTFLGRTSLLTTGANYLGNQIFVTLNKSFKRDPYLNVTNVRSNIATYSGYVQNAFDFGKLHLDLGLRYDLFYFGVKDKNFPEFNGSTTSSKFQPKVAIAYHLSDTLPISAYFNYGRGVNSQDARGIAQRPEGPKVATTDFYQTGFAFNKRAFSLSSTFFLIDNSATQVYITDDNTIEFQGSSRSYGYEVKNSIKLNSHFSLNLAATRVLNSFFKGTNLREFLSNAPSFTFNSNLVLSNLSGFTSVISYRHINNYLLDSVDTSLRASGLDVVDLKVSKKLVRGFELSMGIDNLLNKKYFEVQNFGESRARPNDPIVERVHATPGYPFSLTFGITFRFREK